MSFKKFILMSKMTNKYNIYLDNAATTKPNPEVVALNEKINEEYFANPNSIHHLGLISNSLVDKARQSLLNEFKLSNHKVIFTSCSTESLNLAIKGYVLKYKNRGRHIITSNIEHPAVSEAIKQLKDEFNYEVTILNVNSKGVISLDELKQNMKDSTILVSIMAINNEIGSINPINEIAEIVHKYPKCSLLVDTTQAIGKIQLDYSKIDMFTISAHKIYGLKNSGALFYKKNISFLPLLSGGGQEDGYRSGTLSTPDAISLAKAVQLINKNFVNSFAHVKKLNDSLREKISKIDGIHINSDNDCSPFIFNFSLINKKASVVVEALSNIGIYVSSVSACHSKSEQPSYVIKAITSDDNLAKNTIRISFSDTNSLKEVDILATELKNILEIIR